jgi:hypothetical protein
MEKKAGPASGGASVNIEQVLEHLHQQYVFDRETRSLRDPDQLSSSPYCRPISSQEPLQRITRGPSVYSAIGATDEAGYLVVGADDFEELRHRRTDRTLMPRTARPTDPKSGRQRRARSGRSR